MDKRVKIAKAVVFILTSLIIIGTVLLFYIIANDRSVKERKFADNINLKQEIGSEIKDFKVNQNNLYIHIKNGLDNEKILIIDAKKGNIATEIVLH